MIFDEVLRGLKIFNSLWARLGRGELWRTAKAKVAPAILFGAHFAEVTMATRHGAVTRVPRRLDIRQPAVSSNPMTARNQIEGVCVMGIGMALFEGTEYDAVSGAPSQCQSRRLYGRHQR